MTANIPEQYLKRLNETISSKMGLNFSEARLKDLEREIINASSEFDFTDPLAFIEWLSKTPLSRPHIEKLARHLTIGETYFFREKETYGALEEHVLAGLIRARADGAKRLRIWSAGCSSGEEPYSIAMILTRMIGDLKGWNITILGTDINPQSLKKAAEGRYSEWSFRTTPDFIRANYFKKTADGLYEIVPEVKKMVEFAYLNLAEDIYPSLLTNTNAMDVILCRNVLMYFSQDSAKRAIEGFGNSLVDGGWLLISPTDAFRGLSDKFKTVNFHDAIMYTKHAGDEGLPAHAHRGTEAPAPYYRKAGPPAERAEAAPAGFDLDALLLSAGEAKPPVAPASPAPEAEDETHYADAVRLFDKGRYAEAAGLLEKTASRGEAAKGSALLITRAYANAGALDAAARWGEKAVLGDRLNPAAHYLFATILSEQGRPEEAVRSLRTAIYLDGKFALAYFALGNLMLRQGDAASAWKHFKNALSILSAKSPDEVMPESEGLTAGRLAEIISSMTAAG